MIKKTIVKVRGGGQQSMFKDHTFVLFNFETLPLLGSLGSQIQSNVARVANLGS